MTQGKLIPTNGKRPDGLNDDDYVWVQHRDGHLHAERVRHILCRDDLGEAEDIVAYCLTEPPEPYVPEPDYSKWVGCLCWVWDAYERDALARPLDRYVPEKGMPFRAGNTNWLHCRPLTPDEVWEYLKKAEEACK